MNSEWLWTRFSLPMVSSTCLFNRGMSSQNVTLDVGTVYREFLANLFGQLPEIYSHPRRIANLPANFSIE